LPLEKATHKLAEASSMPIYEQKQWEEDLTKRIDRLKGKI
jgi:hypothetical protein